jgi:hypothetical protein
LFFFGEPKKERKKERKKRWISMKRFMILVEKGDEYLKLWQLNVTLFLHAASDLGLGL